MTQLTLESLAARIESLERKVAELTRTTAPAIRPGTGDWDAAAKAAAAIRASNGFDFDALRDQDECDLRHANDHLQ
jgi:hypothetical protein